MAARKTRLRKRIAPETLRALDQVVYTYTAKRSLDVETAVTAVRAIHGSLTRGSWESFSATIYVWAYVTAQQGRAAQTITPEMEAWLRRQGLEK